MGFNGMTAIPSQLNNLMPCFHTVWFGVCISAQHINHTFCSTHSHAWMDETGLVLAVVKNVFNGT